MLETIEKAILLATISYSGVKDKAGDPLILHAMRVAARPELSTEIERIVGVLHDAIEDSPMTAEYLRKAGIPGYAIEAIVVLTRLPKEPYFRYIDRVRAHELARRVKVLDIKDHLENKRKLPPEDRGLIKRYEKALAILEP